MDSSSRKNKSKQLTIGFITGIFGVQGWLKVHSYSVPREAILNYQDWLVEKDNKFSKFKLIDGRKQGKNIVALLKGINNRDEAKCYLGSKICVQRNSLPETKDNEYYWVDLEGLKVKNYQGLYLGKVDYIIETGANDVLVIKGSNSEILIPFIMEDVVKKVDLDLGEIIVDWESE